ncbi:MAG: TRAP transporter small permease [Clostridiales bacterium]|nr:TRAP transporter small permease [Clostridiales bacterium]
MAKFEKFIEVIMKLVVFLSCISLSFIVAIITINVIGRAISHPVLGAFDLITLGAAVSASLAIAYTTYKKGHVKVDVFVDMMPPMVKKVQFLVSELAFLFVFGLITWQSYVIMMKRLSSEFTETLYFSLFPFRLLFLISLIITCILVIFNIIKGLKGADAK